MMAIVVKGDALSPADVEKVGWGGARGVGRWDGGWGQGPTSAAPPPHCAAAPLCCRPCLGSTDGAWRGLPAAQSSGPSPCAATAPPAAAGHAIIFQKNGYLSAAGGPSVLLPLLLQAMASIDGLDAVVSTIGGTPADPTVDSQVWPGRDLGWVGGWVSG